MNIMYGIVLMTTLKRKKKLCNHLKLKKSSTFHKTFQEIKVRKEVMKALHREEKEKVLHKVMNL